MNQKHKYQTVEKEANIKQIFDAVHESGRLSQSEICKKIGLGKATVSVLVNELLKCGLLREVGGKPSAKSTSGRNPVALEVNGEAQQVAVISLRKKEFHFVLYDLAGKEIDSFSHKIAYKKGFGKKMWADIAKLSESLSEKKLAAVCVSLPSFINVSAKTIGLSSVLKIGSGCDPTAELEAMRPRIPLLLANGACAAAYNEYRYAYKKKIAEMIYFYFGEGVGAGILLNKKVFTGEIGHIVVDPDGAVCGCGKRGCMETIVGKQAVLRAFAGKYPDYAAIGAALESGNAQAKAAAEKVAAKMAFCISNVICMFNPSVIVLGGEIRDMGEVFLAMVAKKVKIPWKPDRNMLATQHLSYTKSGIYADTRGAFAYYLDNFYTITLKHARTVHFWN